MIPDPTVAGTRPRHPFPGSIYTTPLPANPTPGPSYAVSCPTVWPDGWTPTRYLVHGNSAEWVTVQVNPGFVHPGTPSGTLELPIPPGAVPDTSSDGQCIIWDLDSEQLWELWGAKTNHDGTWTTQTIVNAKTDGSFPGSFPTAFNGLYSSSAASRLTYSGGIITVADVASGSIDHTLSLALPNTSPTFVAPATSSDGKTQGGIPEGTRLFLPATIATPSGLNSFAAMVFTGLQKYGAYVIDTGGPTIYAENRAPWDAWKPGSYTLTNGWGGASASNVLTGIPWASLAAVEPS